MGAPYYRVLFPHPVKSNDQWLNNLAEKESLIVKRKGVGYNDKRGMRWEEKEE